MKKILTLLMVMLSMAANSQIKEFVVEHCLETKTFTTNESLICSNESKTKWFAIQPIYEPNNYYPINKGVRVFKFGFGNINTENLLVFTFFDGSITVLKNTGEIDNENSFIFNFTEFNLESLRTKTVTNIKFINVTQSESYTYECKDNEGSFFSNGFTNIIIKKIKCK